MYISDAQYAELIAKIMALEKRVNYLEKENAELRKRLRFYDNAHTPPSRAIQKQMPENTEHEKSGRSDGHAGVGRKTPDIIHKRKSLKRVKICPDCGRKVGLKSRRKRVITRLVPGHAENVEFEVPQSWCNHCRKSVEPVVPNALPSSRFDLSFALFVACLKMLGVSLDKVRFLLEQDYGISVSSATLVNTMNKLAGFLGTGYEKLRLELNREKSVHGDETGWKIKGRNNWLWEFVSKKIAYYSVESSRGKDVPKKVLDDFAGTLSVDFWNAYNSLDCEKQRCWAHLARELKKVMEDDPSKEFGKFSDEILGLFHWSRQERNHGHKTRIKAENKLEKILNGKYRDKNCLRLVKRLKRHKHELFTFCSRKGLSPNNNHAERNIRPSVVIRKTSYGSQSEKGAKTFATFMSFFQTSKLQEKNFHEYMQETIKNEL